MVIDVKWYIWDTVERRYLAQSYPTRTEACADRNEYNASVSWRRYLVPIQPGMDGVLASPLPATDARGRA